MFYKEMYFLSFLKKFPFPIRVFQTNVYKAASEQGGGVAQRQGAVFNVLLCKWFPWRKIPVGLAR